MIKFQPNEKIRIDRTGVHVNPEYKLTSMMAGVVTALDAHIKHLVKTVAEDEREACAKIVDGNADGCDGLMERVLRSNAAAIRARSQA